jgi:long-subunit acyl-CoA synthetase (AMP-forming)
LAQTVTLAAGAAPPFAADFDLSHPTPPQTKAIPNLTESPPFLNYPQPPQRAEACGLKVLSWAQALAAGKAAPAAPVPPTADDYCTIMYTSGTTGG